MVSLSIEVINREKRDRFFQHCLCLWLLTGPFCRRQGGGGGIILLFVMMALVLSDSAFGQVRRGFGVTPSKS